MKNSNYHFFSNIKYMIGLIWQTNKTLLITRLLFIPVSLLSSLINIATPAILVAVALYSKNIEDIIIAIAVLFGAWMLIDMACTYVKTRYYNLSTYISSKMFYDIQTRLYDMDACHMFEPETREKLNKVFNALSGKTPPAIHFISCFFDILVYIPGIVIFTLILGSLNPWLIILIICTTILSILVMKWSAKSTDKLADVRTDFLRQYRYLKWISGDFKLVKYIRLNRLMPLFDAAMQRFNHLLTSRGKVLYRNNRLFYLLSFLIILIRDLTSYGFLIYKTVCDKSIDVAAFLFYFAVITELATLFKNTFDKLSALIKFNSSVSDYRNFFDIKDTFKREGGQTPDLTTPPVIEFCNVSYRYPASDTFVIKDVSFIIKSGEKIALTGLNGSGKTTMTMLMCGLLLPTEGTILINGHPISEYNRSDLYSLFGLVPQKACFLPLSVAENITLTEPSQADTDKLSKCTNTVGLELKADSPVTGLSEGEKQKLLLARALYRNAPILILDEPTASLDPIAEDAIYKQYNKLTSGCTSVFISHRLSSTRFCDRIFLLDEGHIAEEGSHEELIKLSGRYAELFNLQSSYYQKESSAHE